MTALQLADDNNKNEQLNIFRSIYGGINFNWSDQNSNCIELEEDEAIKLRDWLNKEFPE